MRAKSRTSLRVLNLLPLLRQSRLVSGGGLVQFCLEDIHLLWISETLSIVLLFHYRSNGDLLNLLDAIQETETKKVVMSALNHQMSTQVLQQEQAQQIEALYEQAKDLRRRSAQALENL